MHRGNGNLNAILEACSFHVQCNLWNNGETLPTIRLGAGLAARIMVQFTKAGQVLPPAGRVTVKMVAGEETHTAGKMIGNWYVMDLSASDVEDLAEETEYKIVAKHGTGTAERELYGGRGTIEHFPEDEAEGEGEGE